MAIAKPAATAFRKHTRLLIISALIVFVAAALLLTGRGGHPTNEIYEGGRQQLMQADLTYRLALFWEQFTVAHTIPGLGEVRNLREQAVATYERQVLGTRRPNPAALHRLGVIYGERGYSRQAYEALTRAATVDERKADLYFALAQLYAPAAPGRALSPQLLPRLQDQEQWLADPALRTYYLQQGDEAAAARAAAAARDHLWRFGLEAIALFCAYGLLGLLGLLIVVRYIIRRGFYIPPPPATRPPLVVPWTALDALEVVGAMYVSLAVLGLLAAFVLRGLGDSGTVDLLRAGVIALQYLLFMGVTIAVLWGRVRAPGGSRLRILGMRLRRFPGLIWEGLGGYGLLVFLAVAAAPVLRTLLRGLVPMQGGERLAASVQTPAARILLFVLICLVAPVLEEIVFRGFVYPALRRRLSVFASVVASALLFALMHQNPQALAPITVIGIVLAVLYERNRSLVPCILCHALNNTLVFLLLTLGQ